MRSLFIAFTVLVPGSAVAYCNITMPEDQSPYGYLEPVDNDDLQQLHEMLAKYLRDRDPRLEYLRVEVCIINWKIMGG